MVAYGLQVRLKGPIAEGRAPAVLKGMTKVALDEIADYTRHEVLMQLDRVLQNPTGYYESRIVKNQKSMDVVSINDAGVIYGPWLEGVGSRNAPVTRFEGYHTFRTVRGRIAGKAGEIANAAVSRVMGELQ